MRHFAVAVRDVKADGFAAPFFVPTLGMAERSFSDEVNRAESPMFAHAEDYSLYHVGFFEDDGGVLVADGPPRLLVTAVAVLRVRN